MPVTLLKTGQRLVKLGTAALSDAIGKSGAMDHEMHSLSANPKMAGPAYTVRIHPADILMVAAGLSQCPKGSVLVIDGQGELNTALWGELTTLAAELKGLAGVVIDGAVRDSYTISRSRFPVFARAVVPNAGGGEYIGELNAAVQCGGQVVRPGDWLVGDEDGVVVIPAERLADAIATAERIIAAEKEIERAIRKGVDLGELLRCQEIIDRKRSDVLLPQFRAVPPKRRP